jgi:hypothetical protein
MSEDANTKTFTVFVPQGNGYSDPKTVQLIADHFAQFKLNAEFVTKNGVPVQDGQGAYTLVTRDQKAESLAPCILDSHYGLIPIPN